MAYISRLEDTAPFAGLRQRAPASDDDASAVPSRSAQDLPFPPADNAYDADPRSHAPDMLTQRDVAALVINKMIGTGIFTGTYTVLVSTQSKSVAMGLWVIGFGYTILRLLVYLEFARKLPFTGGEIVYLDDFLTPKFRLWAYTLYAFCFVLLFTTSTNALQFASQIILAAYKKASWTELPQAEILLHLQRFFAITITTAICLLLYISNAKSRLFNKATAAAKVLGLLIIAGFGAAYLQINGTHSNWTSDDSLVKSRPDHNVEWVPALIVVLYSFHGWENATLVASEISSFSVLKWGVVWGVSVVGALYLLLAGISCAAFDWNDGPLPNFTAAYLSTPESPKGQVSETAAVATAVLIALSSFGSMLSAFYTGVRVKQSIGWTNILPWSWFWRRAGPLRPRYFWREVDQGQREVALIFDQDALTHPDCPEGGIILNWLTTFVWICLSAGFSNNTYAVEFAGNMLVYGRFFVEGEMRLVGLGFIWFDPYQERFQNTGYPALDWYRTESDRNPAPWMRQNPAEPGKHWSLSRLRGGPLQTLLGIIILAISLIIVIADLLRPEGRTALGVVGSVLVAGWMYWWVLVRYRSAKQVFKFFGYEIMPYTHGEEDLDLDPPTRICHWCITLHAWHRHPHDSYLSFNEFLLLGKPRPRFLYTIFGDGSKAAFMIQSWPDFMSALRGCLSTEDVE